MAMGKRQRFLFSLQSSALCVVRMRARFIPLCAFIRMSIMLRWQIFYGVLAGVIKKKMRSKYEYRMLIKQLSDFVCYSLRVKFDPCAQDAI